MTTTVAGPNIVAQCIATSGYGTDVFDAEIGECYLTTWASVDRVLVNEAYWSQYETDSSGPLNVEFELGCSFDRYLLTVYQDGTKTAVMCDVAGVPEVAP